MSFSFQVLFWLCLITKSFARESEFYLGTFRNRGVKDDSLLTLLIVNQEALPADVFVETEQGIIITEVASPNSTIELNLPSNITVFNSTQRRNGVYVRTSTEVTLTLLNSKPNSSDAYLIYPNIQPTDSDQYTYYAVTPGQSTTSYMSQILLVATENDTKVTIRPSQNINLPIDLQNDHQSQFTIVSAMSNYHGMLNRLETLLVGSVGLDLTGTLITSNKPLVIISGHECAQFNTDKCSFIAEQIPPTTAWGREYILSPIVNGTTQQYIALTSANDTTVTITCNKDYSTNFTLSNEGDWIKGNLSTQQYCLLKADTPVLVSFINTFSDHPLMTLVPPIEQFKSNIRLSAFTCDSDRSLLLMVSNRTGGRIFYNDIHIKDELLFLIPGSHAAVFYLPDAIGESNITSLSGNEFGIIMYGSNNYCTYSYSVVWNLTLLEVPVVTFGASSYSIYENDMYVFITINRTTLLGAKTLVKFVALDNSGDLLSCDDEVITLESGEATKVINITVIDDEWVESPNNIPLVLLPLFQAVIGPYNESLITINDDDNITVGLMGTIYDPEFNSLSVNVEIIEGTLAPNQYLVLGIVLQETAVGNANLSYTVVSQTTTVKLSRVNTTSNATVFIKVSLASYSILNVILNPSNISDELGNFVSPKKCEDYIIGQFTQNSLLISSCVAGSLLLLCMVSFAISIATCGVSYQSRRKWILGSGLNRLYFQDDAMSLATNDPESYELMNRLGETKTASLAINDDNEYNDK